MSQYWLKDSKGGVLGPVSLGVVRDLAVAQRLQRVTQVSRDGKLFMIAAQMPEVAALLQPPPGTNRHPEELARAAQVRKELERLRGMTPAELFGVPRTATLREYRQGFLELGKRYHPGRLAKEAHPDLVRASMEVFSFLTEQMNRIDAELNARTPRVGSIASGRPAAAPSGPIVEFRPGNGEHVQVMVQLSEGDTSIFTQHRLVNFSSGGLFVATTSGLPLGTRLELVLRFVKPVHEIRSRGVVVFENVGAPGRDLPGVGIRMQDLTEADRSFIKQLPGMSPGR